MSEDLNPSDSSISLTVVGDENSSEHHHHHGSHSGGEKKTALKVTSSERTEIKEDLAVDKISRTIPVRIFMTCVWLLCLAVFIYFLYGISSQYISGKTTPSSSITYVNAAILPVAKVVICNWNQDGSLVNSTPSHDCPTCLLKLVQCIDWSNNASDCTSQWDHTPVQTNAGLFDCYTYNGDINNKKWTDLLGYAGAIATVWGVTNPEFDDPPVNRIGAQASFFLNDGSITDPNAIYGEYRYAPTGFDSFYAVKYVQTLHQEDNPASNTSPNSSRYDTVASTITLASLPNPNTSYVGISFAFQNLNMEIDLYFTAYSLQNFWGDFAGMVGTLMGLDAIKVASATYVAYIAFKLRAINPIEDHFNG